jgi:hypothetical protein
MANQVCVFCERGPEVTPILTLDYRGGKLFICAQHLPVLIHDPSQLIGLVPGAEDLQPSDHKD